MLKFTPILLILLFAVHWRLLPASGMYAVYGGGDLPDLEFVVVNAHATLQASYEAMHGLADGVKTSFASLPCPLPPKPRGCVRASEGYLRA